jgi:hypothetical protein
LRPKTAQYQSSSAARFRLLLPPRPAGMWGRVVITHLRPRPSRPDRAAPCRPRTRASLLSWARAPGFSSAYKGCRRVRRVVFFLNPS